MAISVPPARSTASPAVGWAERLDSPTGYLALFTAAAVLRLVLAPALGFHGDLQLFQRWATRLDDVGPRHFYAPGVFADYPPGYLYVLWLLGKLSSAPGYVLLKAPAILGDGALAWLAGTLAARLTPAARVHGIPVRVLAVVLVLFNPAVLAVGAVWGQVDVIPAALVVATLLLLLTGTPSALRDCGAMAVFALAVSMKPQAGFVFPVLLYALCRRYLFGTGGRTSVRGVLTVAAIGSVSFEVWAVSGLAFGLDPLGLVRFYASSSSVYPVTSAWAFNLWGAVGFWRNDSVGDAVVRVLGIPALHVGTICVLAGTAFVLWRAHRAIQRGAPDALVLCVAAASVSLLAYALLTRMHERYLFTSLALLTPLVAWRWLRRGYVVLSLLFVANLWYPFAYFNVQWGVRDLKIEPLFTWVFGPLLVTDTWQKKTLSLAVLAACLAVALASLDRLRSLEGRGPSVPQMLASLRERWRSREPITAAPVDDEVVVEAPAPSWRRWLPVAGVAAVCLFNLVVLRGETTPAPNLNDSALHLQMVRWASHHLDAGRIPLDGWYPYLSLGSAHFHHYQSLPHTLTAFVAEVLSADATTVYLWIQYLGLALWPIAVYLGTRLLGWSRWVGVAAAALSPVVVSLPGYGFEHMSYTWQGYGVYSQLWGMWALPFALGWSWRAITTGRGYTRAIAALAFTIAVHFLTAYLAIALVGVFGLVAWRELRTRLVRTAAVIGGALVTAAWVLVPLLADRAWSAQSEFYEDTTFRDSFGAGKILGWLVSGELFDSGRLPIVTLLAAVGLVVTLRTARTHEGARAVLAAGGVSLLLFFGRPTLGPLIDLLPGSDDLQIHRFIMGVHLMGLVLAGIGLVAVVTAAAGAATRRVAIGSPVPGIAIGLVVAVALLPNLREQADYDLGGADYIRTQRAAERTDGADLAALIDRVRDRGDGRAYAGLRANWGATYTVGYVPVFAQLANADVDAIGFTFRTVASLSTDIEASFDETNPSHYEVMNVKYVLLPADRRPAVPAQLLEQRGRHRLYEVDTTGYFQVVDRVGAIAADRTDLASANRAFLASELPLDDTYLGVAFDGRPAPNVTTDGQVPGPPGRVSSQLVQPVDGRFAATVDLRRPAVVLLKATFDPHWMVTVDGRAARTVMMTPSLVGVDVPAGRHDVAFRYRPYSSYPGLVLLGAVTLAVAAAVPRRASVRRRRVVS